MSPGVSDSSGVPVRTVHASLLLTRSVLSCGQAHIRREKSWGRTSRSALAWTGSRWYWRRHPPRKCEAILDDPAQSARARGWALLPSSELPIKPDPAHNSEDTSHPVKKDAADASSFGSLEPTRRTSSKGLERGVGAKKQPGNQRPCRQHPLGCPNRHRQTSQRCALHAPEDHA